MDAFQYFDNKKYIHYTKKRSFAPPYKSVNIDPKK